MGDVLLELFPFVSVGTYKRNQVRNRLKGTQESTQEETELVSVLLMLPNALKKEAGLVNFPAYPLRPYESLLARWQTFPQSKRSRLKPGHPVRVAFIRFAAGTNSFEEEQDEVES